MTTLCELILVNLHRFHIVFVSMLSGGALTGIPFFEPVCSVAMDLPGNDETPLLAQSSSAPPVAPSFLKQAGQKFLESAQKKVLHNVNERLQGQPANETRPPQTTQDSTPASGAVVATAKQNQGAPCRSWVNSQERPIACLLCIHGLGLQSNSYEFFGKEISDRGIAVYAIDVRGFGSWMKAGGKTKVNFDECLADVKQSLESIRAANPGLPTYLLGESMGGAIALRAASMYPELVDGLISSVPAGERFNQGKTSMKVFLNLLAGFDVANVGNDIVNQATKSAKLRTQWTDDPLSRLNLSPQELIQFQDFMNNNHEAAKNLRDMPVLLVEGNGDQLVKPEGTWELFNSVASKDKSFFAVPGEHLIFEEAQTQEAGPRDQNFRVIQSWLSTKVGRRNRRGGMPRTGATDGGDFAGRRTSINIQGLEGPARMIESGDYASAISELEAIRAQRPNDPNVLSLLGRAYYKNGQPDKAGPLFRTAMRMGRSGGDQGRAINGYLLDLSREAQSTPGGGQPGLSAQAPASMLSPFTGFGGNIVRTVAATATAGSAIASPSSKGKVYAFFASWADQCKGLSDLLAKLASIYGDRVDITKVNIEDASSNVLVDQYKIGPIPTVVFVAPNGDVTSAVIGESTYSNYEEALKAIAQPSHR